MYCVSNIQLSCIVRNFVFYAGSLCSSLLIMCLVNNDSKALKMYTHHGPTHPSVKGKRWRELQPEALTGVPFCKSLATEGQHKGLVFCLSLLKSTGMDKEQGLL